MANVANRADFAVIPVDGFNPERAKNLKEGMELTLGGKIEAAVIFDRDFRSDAECAAIAKGCSAYCSLVALHNRKEIENFLLVPAAIDRAAAGKVSERQKRGGKKKGIEYDSQIAAILDKFAGERKSNITAQHLGFRRRFERTNSPTVSEETISEYVLKEIETMWSSADKRFHLVPGKEAVSAVNLHLQDRYSVHVAPSAIIDAMHIDKIPEDMKLLISRISSFAASKVQGEIGKDDD